MFFTAVWFIAALYIFKRKGIFDVSLKAQPAASVSLLDTVWVLLIFIASYTVSSWLFHSLKSQEILSFCFFSLLLFLFIWAKGNRLKSFFSLDSFYPNVLFGASLWFLAFPLVSLWSNALDSLILQLYNIAPVEQLAVRIFKQKIREEPHLALVFIFLYVFFVPLIEEIIFRVFLQNALRNYFSAAVAIAMTSFFFAFFHFSPAQGITNITLISSLFILSCFLGLAMEKKRSVWASFGLHAMFNGVSILFILGMMYFD